MMNRLTHWGLMALAFVLPATLQAGGLEDLLEEASAFGEAVPVAPFMATDFALQGENTVTDYHLMEADPAAWNRLLSERPMNILLEVPTQSGTLELNLTALQSPLADDFRALTSDGGSVNYVPGMYYKGLINGNPNSLAAVSFFEDDVVGIVSVDGFTWVLGKLRGDHGGTIFSIHRDVDVLAQNDFSCGTDAIPVEDLESAEAPQHRGAAVCRAVNVRFDCDYNMYTRNGFSVTNTNNFVTGFFNGVQAVYLVDGFEIYIEETNVFTSTDPYAGFSSSADYLYTYRADMNGMSWNGDLAHFLTTRSAGLGGRAYLDGNFCSRGYDYAFSNIWDSYSIFPAYSWTIDVVAHEFGHNYGSPHTHNCSWSGGAIDNCYATEGGCASGPPPPSTGGTIMSYCHLTSFGKDFTLGFHPQPVALMQSNIDAMTCLQPCGGTTTCDAPTDLVSVPGSGSANLSWDPVPGATSYTIRGRRGTSSWREKSVTGTSRFVGGLAKNKTFEWQAQAICGGSVSSWSSSDFFTTLTLREGQFSVSIYPNPVVDRLMVQPEEGGLLQVDVLDQAGRKVRSLELQATAGVPFAVDGLGTLPAGLYHLRLTGEHGTASLRFSK